MRLAKIAFTTIATVALVGGTAVSASALSAQACANGYEGVIVEHDGHYTSVCQNII